MTDRPKLLEVWLFALICAVAGLSIAHFWWVTDDAYISFRYALNWAHGLGLTYDAADVPPVEGYSNFLWVALAALIAKLGGDLPKLMPCVSAVSGLLVAWRIFRLLRGVLRVALVPAALAVAALAWSAAFGVWSTSGLETMPFALLLLLAAERLILADANRREWATGLLLLAIALLRVEGIFWVAALLALGALTRRAAGTSSRGIPFAATAICIVGYGLYAAWRFHHFGELMSNTAHAKSGMSASWLWRGVSYVAVQWLTNPAQALIIPAGVAIARARSGTLLERRSLLLAFCGLALAFPAWSILVSGDFMPFGRFLWAGLPFATVVVGAWLGRLWDERRTLAITLASAAIVLGVLPTFDLGVVPEAARAAFHFRHNVAEYKSELAQWQWLVDETENGLAVGCALRALAKPGDTLVYGAIGAVGYASQLRIYDRYGLVTREVHPPPDRDAAQHNSPGHDRRVDPPYFLPQRPTFLTAELRSGRSATVALARRFLLPQARALPSAREYAPELYRLEEPARPAAEPRYLVLTRRIADETTADAAWAAAGRTLSAFAEGAEPPALRCP